MKKEVSIPEELRSQIYGLTLSVERAVAQQQMAVNMALQQIGAPPTAQVDPVKWMATWDEPEEHGEEAKDG